MTTLCALILIDRGELDMDSPVARYWPEFAQAGKSEILVRWLLSHSAGLPGFDQIIPMEALYDWNRTVHVLERQEPWWEPGTQSGYHVVTFGYLVGELVRRISGKSLGAFFHDEVAVPLGADFHIGLSREHDARVAELIAPQPIKPLPLEPGSVAARTWLNTPIIPGYSDRAWRGAEIPSSNGHGNARSAARVGSLLACGGWLDSLSILSKATIDRAIEEQFNGMDLVLGVLGFPVRWGLGFGLASEALPFLSPRSFFWGGFGGSWLEMDPEIRVCISYVMNRLEADPGGGPRMIGLRSALFDVVKQL